MNSDSLNFWRPWLGIALLLAAARVLLAAINALRRRGLLGAELARKGLHLGMGTILLACPWMFHRAWPVLLLAAAFGGLLLASRQFPFLRAHVGGVIYAVERQSVGEYCFPAAVAGLFCLARGDVLLFCIPLSLLTYADAAAALVGARYGSIRFRTPGGRKSVEGCLAFAAVAFIVTHVPLLLAGRVSPGASLMIAASIALTGMAVEAVCWRGLDNLAVPLVGLLLLRMT